MKRVSLVFLIITLIGVVVAEPYYGSQYGLPQFINRKYGGSFSEPPPLFSPDKSLKKVKTSTHKSDKSLSQPGNQLKKACPPAPELLNAGVLCSQYTGCRATCKPKHQFPNGAREVFLVCDNGNWKVEGTNWNQIPSCEPICLPQCQNNGICVKPNQCECPENFSGPQCQFEDKPCLNYPAIPVNARATLSSKRCTITCLDGYQFPDGSSITTLLCKNGFWVPAKDKWTSVPNCEPTCNPPCQNGGVCLSLNVCQCTDEFRGPQCQYRADACGGKTLKFNGGYNCTGDSDSLNCIIYCPEGINFEFQPEPSYTCLYSTGVFTPFPIPQCVFPENVRVFSSEMDSSSYSFHQIFNQTNSEFGEWIKSMKLQPSSYHYSITNSESGVVPFEDRQTQFFKIEEILPKPGVCLIWGPNHYKTFDGKIYSFDSKCSHIVLRDSIDNTFSIVTENAKNCYESPENCWKILKIYIQNKEYVLKQSAKGPQLFSSTKKLTIPGRVPGMRVEQSAHHVIISLDIAGIKIKWDGKLFIKIEVRENLWKRTEGLCGKIDGDPRTDLVTKQGLISQNVESVAKSWTVHDFQEQCDDIFSRKAERTKSSEALRFCKKLITNQKFEKCRTDIDLQFLDACIDDYYRCTNQNSANCVCDTITAYVENCLFMGIENLTNWRTPEICPMNCDSGRIYRSCGPKQGQPTCGSISIFDEDTENCIEGCYCPPNTVLHENKCIPKQQCPCKLRGKVFPAGSKVPKDCNSCTCVDGQWVCTQVSCGARCSAIGDPHYITFDGKKYDFMGQCSYYLVKTSKISIEAENVACSGSIYSGAAFPRVEGIPSCTKTVTIRDYDSGTVIKLKLNHEVLVNGQDNIKLPISINNIIIRPVSSMYLRVELPHDLLIWWDGIARVYIDLPAEYPEKTKGLCGTFNRNQKDDFLTPEGDIEQSTIAFANKWKTSAKCNDIPDEIKNHPCVINNHNREKAEQYCSKIKSNLFENCHFYVDPEQYYQDCLYDMCSCEQQLKKCFCPIIGAYAEACMSQGIEINWRSTVRECGVHCTGGQIYQICGNSCARSCNDVQTQTDCVPTCVEGCNCPELHVLNEYAECIPIGECKCQKDGFEYAPAYKEIRSASKGPELCTCINGWWDCHKATPTEIASYPHERDTNSICNRNANMEFTLCEPVELKSCSNMDKLIETSPAICQPGCKCKEGYVWESASKTCIVPQQCPCHHGGKSYHENETVQSDCNVCKCQHGKWKCTDRPCNGECTTWGDGHFKTFDGRTYDFQGQCDYVLSKGNYGDFSFEIIVQDVPCGTLGTSCSKSITIKAKTINKQQESVKLSKDKLLPNLNENRQIKLRKQGLFVIVEILDYGIVLKWDQGTRVYINLDPRWKNQVNGLCGNYNNDDTDDFQTPSGGFVETSPEIFGDSWKLQPYCPETMEIINTCDERPERKLWAFKQCDILKSSLFQPCHSEVPVDYYFEKCIFDSCACDQGGDCECFCTALAVYAQECNNRGVPIKWRSQQLCPMQCDERCSTYSPCISTCPVETCDNLTTNKKLSQSCKEQNCIEGCAPKSCPSGQVFTNSSLLECTPIKQCQPICQEINGTIYYEGDVLKEDDCHTCICARGTQICIGQPCTTTTIQPTTLPEDQEVGCVTGWTEWINSDRLPVGKNTDRGKISDIEPIPGALIMNRQSGAKCKIDNMVDIECRTVGTHIPSKDTGLDVECSLERGLKCVSNLKENLCLDFEIRIKCLCNKSEIEPEKECKLTDPNQEHPDDCTKFYQCVSTSNGSTIIEQTCPEGLLFDPKTKVCLFENVVFENKPSCITQLTHLPKECPDGMVKDDCALDCDHMCLWYQYLVSLHGKCENIVNRCEEGCREAWRQSKCPPGQFWADNTTCVDVQDCLCKTRDGKPAKPGMIYEESDCMICQCINNHYTCSDICVGTIPAESTTTNATVITSTTTITSTSTQIPELPIELELPVEPELPIVPPSVTPPKPCEENFIDLLQFLENDEAFTASTTKSPLFAPNSIKFNKNPDINSSGCWIPKISDTNQYLQIDLGQQEAIYGISIKGSPITDDYVTSYEVWYSPDKDRDLQPVVLNKNPQTPQRFHGGIDRNSAVLQLFNPPFEAEVVRIVPKTWHGEIALKVELLGCGTLSTTTTLSEVEVFTTPTRKTITTPSEVEVFTTPTRKITITTSEFEVFTTSTPATTTTPRKIEVFTTPTPTSEPPMACDEPMGLSNGLMLPEQVSVSSERDKSHSKQHLNLSKDGFWQPLTNSPTEFVQFDLLEPHLVTGLITKGGDSGWVIAYKIAYSNNGNDWSMVLDDKKHDLVFLGNFDSKQPHENRFKLPINARLFRIFPTKWHHNIEMKVEMIGCFKNYPIQEIVATTKPPGKKTTLECNDCPGVETEPMELEACRCPVHKWWNGEKCVPKIECPCLDNHFSYEIGAIFERDDCSECICKLGGVAHCVKKKCPPCEDGISVVSNTTCQCICSPCPSGTILCATSNICIDKKLWCNGIQDCADDETNCGSIERKKPKIQIPRFCPEISCPPGYKKTKVEQNETRFLSPMFRKSPTKTRQTFTKTKTTFRKTAPRKSNCPQYKCIEQYEEEEARSVCLPALCPVGYVSVYDQINVKTHCPDYSCYPKPPPDSVCNISGRIFDTFDGVTYTYDICNHIIARDFKNNNWEIRLKKNCTETCLRQLTVIFDENSLILHQNLMVEYNRFTYTLEQIKKLGKINDFDVSNLGKSILVVFNRHGFWLIWGQNGNVKIGLSKNLLEEVDGLCGYFNDNPRDDKRRPDQSLAATTNDFGNSWTVAGEPQPEICRIRTCPSDIQNEAWKICNNVKHQTMSTCAGAVSIPNFISRCIETACECLTQSNRTSQDACRCLALENFVVECLSINPTLDLTDWRIQEDCPVACDAPLIYHDCYQHRCEPTCDTLDNCPQLPNICFPGCYCPSGMIRNEKDQCVHVNECKDCHCQLLPHLQYLTFDNQNFTVNGTCSYIMSQDILQKTDNNHKFQIIVTNGNCGQNQICLENITIIYETSKYTIDRNLEIVEKIELTSEFVAEFTQIEPSLKVLLKKIQVEILIEPSLLITVKVPSRKFAGKLEGLCGDCGRSIAIPKIDEFISNWTVTTGNEKQCQNRPEEKCKISPKEQEFCQQILDESKFGGCLEIVDSSIYLDWCHNDVCNGNLTCRSIEALAKQCQENDFCVDWRLKDLCPYECPEDLIYQPCGPSCPKTCDNINNKEESCANILREGCYCPHGKVLLNGTCVEPEQCEICDEDGHYSGQEWMKDACTNCTCVGRNLQCSTQACPVDLDGFCEIGTVPETIPNPNGCCDKIICKPEVRESCDEPEPFDCGDNQILKLEKNRDGCNEYVCVCIPKKDCPEVQLNSTELNDGEIEIIDSSGCCNKTTIICRRDLCKQQPPECPQFYQLINQTESNSCCPSYRCEAPKSCIYENQYKSANLGGESLKNESERIAELRQINETWMDGPCRQCKCQQIDDKFITTCTETRCQKVKLIEDYLDYNWTEIWEFDECCPKFQRTACLHNNQTYQIGDKWIDENDNCVNYECQENNNLKIMKSSTRIECNRNCDYGWKYYESETGDCCGNCRQENCIINGKLYKIDDEWLSDDYCTRYRCNRIDNTIRLESTNETCKQLDETYLKDFEIVEIKQDQQCCPLLKPIGCKVGNRIYQPGQVWPSPDGDSCKNITCVQKPNGELIKQEVVEHCKINCDPGWEYQESNNSCCGQCVQTACIIGNNEIKQIGESWQFLDNCTNFLCEKLDNQIVVTRQEETCPILEGCPKELVYKKGCCEFCNISKIEAQRTCLPVPIATDETLGIFQYELPNHGICKNYKTIENLNECKGTCESTTYFDKDSFKFENICKCCQANEYDDVNVELKCDDGFLYEIAIKVPKDCGCDNCHSNKNPLNIS